DANGCTTTNTATVINACAPCTMTAAATATNVSCNGGNDGTATATQAGGTAPFSFTWSNSGNSATINGLIAGTYTVTITDNAGCTAPASATVNEPTAINSSTSSTDETCVGNDGSASVPA